MPRCLEEWGDLPYPEVREDCRHEFHKNLSGCLAMDREVDEEGSKCFM